MGGGGLEKATGFLVSRLVELCVGVFCWLEVSSEISHEVVKLGCLNGGHSGVCVDAATGDSAGQEPSPPLSLRMPQSFQSEDQCTYDISPVNSHEAVKLVYTTKAVECLGGSVSLAGIYPDISKFTIYHFVVYSVFHNFTSYGAYAVVQQVGGVCLVRG